MGENKILDEVGVMGGNKILDEVGEWGEVDIHPKFIIRILVRNS